MNTNINYYNRYFKMQTKEEKIKLLKEKVNFFQKAYEEAGGIATPFGLAEADEAAGCDDIDWYQTESTKLKDAILAKHDELADELIQLEPDA